MEEFANNIMRRCNNDKMSALQYLEHCIRSCYAHRDVDGEKKFIEVRDYIEKRYE